jgi:hypothetical protein
MKESPFTFRCLHYVLALNPLFKGVCDIIHSSYNLRGWTSASWTKKEKLSGLH